MNTEELNKLNNLSRVIVDTATNIKTLELTMKDAGTRSVNIVLNFGGSYQNTVNVKPGNETPAEDMIIKHLSESIEVLILKLKKLHEKQKEEFDSINIKGLK